MARPPKNHEAAAELGAALMTLHQQHGQPTPKEIELWINREFRVHVSDESIRKAHRGQVDPNTCALELLAGVAAYYGVAPIDLTPVASTRFLALVQMAGVEPEFTPRDLGFAMKRCTRAWQLTLEGLASVA